MGGIIRIVVTTYLSGMVGLCVLSLMTGTALINETKVRLGLQGNTSLKGHSPTTVTTNATAQWMTSLIGAAGGNTQTMNSSSTHHGDDGKMSSSVAPPRTSSSSLPINTLRDLDLALIHVGKTGGTTLDSKLLRSGCDIKRNPKVRHECHDFLDRHQPREQECELSRHTKVIAHYDKVEGRHDTFNGLVFTVREPISRLESAYFFDSPFHCSLSTRGSKCRSNMNEHLRRRRVFYDHFPNLDSIARGLKPLTIDVDAAAATDALPSSANSNTTTTANDPIDLLHQYFRHVGPSGVGHTTAGYRHYIRLAGWNPRHNLSNTSDSRTYIGRSINRKSPRPAKTMAAVFAVRTESLWRDAESIDIILGGHGNFSLLYSEKVEHIPKSGRVNQTKFVDGAIETLYVCCALLPEIQAYRTIMDHAMNLMDDDRTESYQMTWKRCGVSDWNMLEDKCSDMPLSIDRQANSLH